MMLVMVEGSVPKPEAIPGRPLSLKEARSRLTRLVEGEKESTKEEIMPVLPEKEVPAEEDQVTEVGVPKAAAPPPVVSDTQVPKADDDEAMTEEEQKGALKTSLKEAVRWLAAWLVRQKKKLTLES